MEFQIVKRILQKLLKTSKSQNEYRCLLGSRNYSYYNQSDSENKFPPKFNQGHEQQSYPRGYGSQRLSQGYGRSSFQNNTGQGFQSNRGQGFQSNRGQGFQSNRGQGFQSQNAYGKLTVPPTDWSAIELPTIRKNIYTESDAVCARSPEEVADFRKKHEITVHGQKHNCNPILKFSDCEFPSDLQNAFDSLNYESPMPIQSETWPILLSGYDLIGIGQTGSGKTLGFAIPAILHAISQPQTDGANIIVLAPTRELAQQITSVFDSICSKLRIPVVCIYGGEPKYRQFDALQRNPKIIVATPGRLMDFMASRVCNLTSCTYFILDEADRMLDMGFEPQIRSISTQIRADRQTLMWSATWPKDVRQLAATFTKNPVHINLGSVELNANKNIKQDVVCCEPSQTFKLLIAELKALKNREKVLIFIETQRDTERLSHELIRHGLNSKALHGGLRQNIRNDIINDFRNGSTTICVATDVASRGLDVPDISLVVNYEVPRTIDSYIHRIGRTGRANKSGNSLTFFTRNDRDMAVQLADVLRKCGQDIPEALLHSRAIYQFQ